MSRGLTIPTSSSKDDFIHNSGGACTRCEYGEAGNKACEFRFKA